LDYKIVFAILFIIIGVFLAFFGRFLVSVTVFILGALLSTAGLLLIFYKFLLTSVTPLWISWSVFGGAILVGLLIGFILTKFPRVDSFIISIGAGFILGVLLNESVLYLFGSRIVFWSVNGGIALICGLLALVWYDEAIILSTSFIGSFLIARAISLFCGHFPTVLALIKKIEAGVITH
jgi:uncharacterized membrane protein HdeD (DUF308 family)